MVLGTFKISPPLEGYMTITEDFERFHYFNFEASFLKD